MSKTISIPHIVCDILLLLCFGIPIIILKKWGTPHKRGFYCNDETIRYPYRDSTVSSQLLLILTLPLPILLIFTTEIIRVTIWASKIGNVQSFRLGRFMLPHFIIRLYTIIGCYLVGLCFESLLTNIAKYTIGRHRPHFMDVCRPNVGYQELYFRMSLSRMPTPRLVLPAIHFVLIGGAFYIALTRVSDYKHHWSDVLAGIVIGSLIGISVALFTTNLIKLYETPTSLPLNKHDLNHR
ncbi:PAP2 family protein [Oesophagostomum dentatum]|uniref:PAP2 family protein n=1 Tax=Oesophagostomum dentatum TaxID=61180 RepID=A0A0B1T8B2_OESDE|nr:PAP2 family protein [Oesophagostomum dentatum]